MQRANILLEVNQFGCVFSSENYKSNHGYVNKDVLNTRSLSQGAPKSTALPYNFRTSILIHLVVAALTN